jgi:hypothetical protein
MANSHPEFWPRSTADIHYGHSVKRFPEFPEPTEVLLLLRYG